MPTEVINLLAGLSPARAVFLAASLFALSLVPFFALLGLHFDRASAVGRAATAVHQVAVHAGHDLNRAAAPLLCRAGRARARVHGTVLDARMRLADRVAPKTSKGAGR
jgi:hypothetical protein